MSVFQSLVANPGIFEFSVFALAIVAGIVGAILGLGGGVLIVPGLTLLFHIDIRYAIGASVVAVIATSSGAAATYVRDHVTNIRVAMLLEVATTLGALSGALLAPYLPTQILFLVFAAILLYSTWIMWKKKSSDNHLTESSDRWAHRLKLHSSYPDQVLGKEVRYSVTGVRLGFFLMTGAGLISGLLGIGSGALKVPAMDGAMKLPIRVSTATSNFMMGVTAAASAGAYYMRGDVLPFLAAPVALGVLLGSFVGSKLMMKIPAARIRKMFIVVLVIIALQMAMKAFGIEVR